MNYKIKSGLKIEKNLYIRIRFGILTTRVEIHTRQKHNYL